MSIGSPIPNFMFTGLIVKDLVRDINSYPADIAGQQEHFGATLQKKHAELEDNLRETYSHEELEQLIDSINTVLNQ